MTDTQPQLSALLERTTDASSFEPAVREAVTNAVAELVSALRDHHSGTAEHSNRLAASSRDVAAELMLAPDVVFEVELVAILHDIGKLAVPADILDLARPLEENELAVVRAHSVRGAEILADVAGLAHLAPLVRACHERWDGTGYPDRLAGERIPLTARIVCTADAFDAMTHDRPYRRALPRPEARRRLEAGAGGAFDPEVVRAVLAAA